jgi:tetratricopeptide (TPR) repeat protein
VNLGKVLDGLVVALMPQKIEDSAAYGALVDSLAPLSNGTILRIAAQDHPVLSDRHPGVAKFEIDEDELLEYLKEMPSGKTAGPSDGRPKLGPAEKAAVEKATGKALLTEATGADLRRLFLDAGAAMQKSQFKLAAKKFRAARMLCHLTGLTDEEATMSVALGSAVLANGDRKGAIAAFRHGRQLALLRGNRALAAQAEFGVAGTYFFAADYRNARASYGEIVELATELPPLRLEALRMQGECFLAEQRAADAIAIFGEAVDAAATLPIEVRQATSYVQSGKTLAAVLDKTGQAARARATEKRLEALASELPASATGTP